MCKVTSEIRKEFRAIDVNNGFKINSYQYLLKIIFNTLTKIVVKFNCQFV